MLLSVCRRVLGLASELKTSSGVVQKPTTSTERDPDQGEWFLSVLLPEELLGTLGAPNSLPRPQTQQVLTACFGEGRRVRCEGVQGES